MPDERRELPHPGVDEATLAALLAPFAERGERSYGEEVSQVAHALQTAWAVRAAGGDDALVVAALLHDVGHLLAEADPTTEDPVPHEEAGADHLSAWFGPAVTEPVRLHVAAKRWLCATDPAYRRGLSEASAASLEQQGGPLAGQDRASFERSPHHRAAVLLRRGDDAAKVPGAEVGTLADHLPLLRRTIRAPASRGG